jgi:Fuc2NAc and GlcNAc transferase
LILKPLLPVNYFWSILIGGGFISFIGFLDDLQGLSPFSRILAQILFVSFIGYYLGAFWFIDHQTETMKALFIFSFMVGSVWIMNTFNFIDGADGLLSTNVVLISLFSGILLFTQDQMYLGLSLLILASVNLAFLIFNWAPARVFMGDCGSLFLGSLFVIIPSYTVLNNFIPLYTWAILLSIFYVETSVTLIYRVLKRKQIFKERHNYHAYQQLVLFTQDHSTPAKLSILIQLFWTLPLSLACFLLPEYGLSILILTLLPMVFVFYYFGPRQASS